MNRQDHFNVLAEQIRHETQHFPIPSVEGALKEVNQVLSGAMTLTDLRTGCERRMKVLSDAALNIHNSPFNDLHMIMDLMLQSVVWQSVLIYTSGMPWD